ncbi:AMP-binding protein [Xanthomonas axonopodis]|uniref:AMP-binding protein n=1 Tax=Xanthomonas axonopodis TaxID=53413 RepID=UPI00148217CA|nr:AMP-binding protein [Xanthomonas axonopodis]
MRPVLQSYEAQYFASDLISLGAFIKLNLETSHNKIVIVRCCGGINDAAMYLGLLVAGLTPLLISPTAPFEQARDAANRLDACIVQVSDFDNKLRLLQKISHWQSEEVAARQSLTEVLEKAFVMCQTSGTSGPPSIIKHSVATALKNASAHLESVNAKRGAIFVTSLPMSFSFQCLTMVLSAVACSGTLHVNPDADFQRLSESLNDLKPDFVNFSPALLRSYCRSEGVAALTKVGCLTVGGASISLPEIELLKRINATGRTDAFITYGATECGPRISTARIFANRSYPEGVIGSPIRGVDMKISPAGVIMVKTPYIGIVEEKGRNAKACVYESDGWYETGDTGYHDGEFFVVTGRAGRSFIHKDVKIVPENIESNVCKIPGIYASIVRPEKIHGVVHVVCYYQCEKFGMISAEVVRDHILNHFPAAQAPTRFYEVSEGVTTDTGKLAIQKDFADALFYT